MITRLLDYQHSYFDYPEKDIQEVLGPKLSTNSRRIYDRFVVLKRDCSFVTPTDLVYQNNFKTLWICAQNMQNRLDEIAIQDFVQRALLDGSFLLIHDLITLIDLEGFASGLNRKVGLRVVKDALDCTQLIEQSIGNPDRIKRAFHEIEALEIYVCELMAQEELLLGEIPFPSRCTTLNQTRYLLRKVLKDPQDQRPLIDFILSLDVLPEYLLIIVVKEALNQFIDDRDTVRIEHLRQIDTLPRFALSLYARFYDAFKDDEQDLELGKYLVVMNGGRCPVDEYTLGSLFLKSVFPENVEVLSFLYKLSQTNGGIPRDYMNYAIKRAKTIKCPRLLEFFEPFEHPCVIM